MDPNYLEALSKAYPWATESTIRNATCCYGRCGNKKEST